MLESFSFVDLFQILLIDLSMAGDNALVVGMAVTALPKEQRKMAMIAGIGAATVLRIVMAFFAAELLQVTGLLVAGGLLLAWVAWKMVREIHAYQKAHEPNPHHAGGRPSSKKITAAIWQILIADISMSLDNVLGVAGVARDHMGMLVLGLGLSVVLMAAASSQIAKLVTKYPKVGYVGAAVILYTAVKMIWDGAQDLWPAIHAFA